LESANYASHRKQIVARTTGTRQPMKLCRSCSSGRGATGRTEGLGSSSADPAPLMRGSSPGFEGIFLHHVGSKQRQFIETFGGQVPNICGERVLVRMIPSTNISGASEVRAHPSQLALPRSRTCSTRTPLGMRRSSHHPLQLSSTSERCLAVPGRSRSRTGHVVGCTVYIATGLYRPSIMAEARPGGVPICRTSNWSPFSVPSATPRPPSFRLRAR
jgi:hypothetical protein